MRDPWKTIHQVAEHTAATYAPGDDAEDVGRCDVQLLLDGTTAALWALQGDAGDADACEAVGALLQSYQAVLQGLFGDLRDLAASAGELTEDLVGFRGPKP